MDEEAGLVHFQAGATAGDVLAAVTPLGYFTSVPNLNEVRQQLLTSRPCVGNEGTSWPLSIAMQVHSIHLAAGCMNTYIQLLHNVRLTLAGLA